MYKDVHSSIIHSSSKTEITQMPKKLLKDKQNAV